jgi:ABC-type branched-subunit amino acid transport system ATPase component
MSVVLSVKNLRAKVDDVAILRGLDLEVGPEERVVRIVGANAAGKTTFLRVIDGVISADRGTCMLDGEEITKLPRARRSVYRITQNPFESIATELSIAENLRLALLRRYIPVPWLKGGRWKEECEQLLRQYGLLKVLGCASKDGLDALAGTISGGQAQCLAFAMAVAAEPKLILADEPTANLDPANTVIVLRLIDEVSRRYPVLLVSHDERVAAICDRSYLLDDGKLTLVPPRHENEEVDGANACR